MRYKNTILLIPILLSIYCCGGSGHRSNVQNKNIYSHLNNFHQNVTSAMDELHPGYSDTYFSFTYFFNLHECDLSEVSEELKGDEGDCMYIEWIESPFFEKENWEKNNEDMRQKVIFKFLKDVHDNVDIEYLKKTYKKFCPYYHDSKEHDQDVHDDIKEQKIDPNKFKVTIADFMKLMSNNTNIVQELIRYKLELSKKLLADRMSKRPIDQMQFTMNFDLSAEIEKQMPLAKCYCCDQIGFEPKYGNQGYQHALVGIKCAYSHELQFCKKCNKKKGKKCYQCNKTLEEIKKEDYNKMLDKANGSVYNDYLKIFDQEVIMGIKHFCILEAYWELFQYLANMMFDYDYNIDKVGLKGRYLGLFDLEEYSTPREEVNKVFYLQMKEIDKVFHKKYRDMDLYYKKTDAPSEFDVLRIPFSPSDCDNIKEKGAERETVLNNQYKNILDQKYNTIMGLSRISLQQTMDIDEYLTKQYNDSYKDRREEALHIDEYLSELDDAFRHIVFLHQCSLYRDINENIKKFLNPNGSVEADTSLIKRFLFYNFNKPVDYYSNILMYNKKEYSAKLIN